MSDAQAAAIVEWARRYDAAGIEYWLLGGWAVDHHAGHVTRPHDDIDFVIWFQDHETVMEMLSAADFGPMRAPLAFIRNGVEFEITLIERAPDGAIVTPGFEDWPWGPQRLPGSGGVRRRAPGCQERGEAHFGEPPRPQDLADAQILQRLQASD